jgi:hypothetical protein
MVFIILTTCLGAAGHHHQTLDTNNKRKLVKPLRKKLNLFHLNTQIVPRSRHSVSLQKQIS